MASQFSEILQIKEPGGIELTGEKEHQGRAPIDISISRTNSIEFPWESAIGILPDDIDVFKETIKLKLNISATSNWELFNLDGLIYKVKDTDKFYYTVVQWVTAGEDTPPSLKSESKVLIYNQLDGHYFEPYRQEVVDGAAIYTLYTETDFTADTISETFNGITHLKRVFRPEAPDIPEFELPGVSIPRPVNPISGGLFHIFSGSSAPNGGGQAVSLAVGNPLGHFGIPSGPEFTLPSDDSQFITGNLVKTLLDGAKSSHSIPDADPIREVIKKPSDWKAQENLEFFSLKQDTTSTNSNALLLKNTLDTTEQNLFYESVADEKNWIARLSDRYYLITLEKENLSFNTLSAFLNDWDTEIQTIDLIAYKQGSGKMVNTLPSSQYFDVTLSAIMDLYQDIQALKKLSGGRDELAKALVSKMSGIADFEFSEFKDAIENIEEKHNSLINANNELLREERILKDRVKKFGYEIREKDGIAEIYQKYTVLRMIREAYRIRIARRIRIGPFKVRVGYRWITRYRNKQITVNKERLINVPETPWADEVKQLEENQFAVHIFALTNDGYVSREGESLNAIMQECELSETIRMRTAVMIPQYEQSATRGLRLIGFDLFVRPLPGDVPSAIPDLSLEESLAYRASWKGVELSELIESINLAPGESRTIAIKQSFESQKTQTQSVTTILDVTEKQSSSFSDFFEQTNRQTKESVKTKEWNAKAKGSYGGFGGSASASGSSKQTNKSFAQQIKRAANQSSREMKKQSRVEVSSKLTESSKLVIDESITSQVQNINDGVSLNLFFYRLDNIYEGGLHLEDLKLTYTRPQPLIKGTNLQDIRTFDFYEFESFLDMITNDSLLVLSNALNDMELQLKAVEIRFTIVFKVFKKIFKEYFYNVPDEAFISYPESLQPTDLINSSESIDASHVSSALTALTRTMEAQKEDYEKVRDQLKEYQPDDTSWKNTYRTLFQKLQDTQESIEQDTFRLLNGIEYNFVPVSGAHLFSIPSNGAYLDCVIGSSTGLETYSENMRNMELQRSKAEVRLLNAQTEQIKMNKVSTSFPVKGVSVSNVTASDNSLTVSFNKALPAGNWLVDINNRVFGGEIANTRKSMVISPWSVDLNAINSIKVIESVSGVFVERQN
ncbi:MAG: hypothetical protein HEP71_34570 [Roseivirga sp.]|nr:hypothetical protein [Roseivirga sp.]